MPHISIKADTVFTIGGFSVTNSLITTYLAGIIFFILAFLYYKNSFSHKKNSLFFLIHFMVNALFNLFSSIFGSKTKQFFPLVASFFFFILLSNWLGLLPGVGSVLIKPFGVEFGHEAEAELHSVPLLRAGTADLNTTLALALVSFTLIQYYGFSFLGLGYLKKFFNFSNPVGFFSGILELVSEFSKIISFAFRLFGNIFAGEVLLVVVAFLVPFLASFPFLLLEVFVGLVQALVFAMLTAVFINTTISEHH